MFCKKSVVVFLTTFVLVGCGYRDADDYARQVQQHMPLNWSVRAYYDTTRTWEAPKILTVEATSNQYKVVASRSPQTGDIKSSCYINSILHMVFEDGLERRHPKRPAVSVDVEIGLVNGSQQLIKAMQMVR